MTSLRNQTFRHTAKRTTKKLLNINLKKKSSRNNHHSFIISSSDPPLVALTVCKCVCVKRKEKK